MAKDTEQDDAQYEQTEDGDKGIEHLRPLPNQIERIVKQQILKPRQAESAHPGPRPGCHTLDREKQTIETHRDAQSGAYRDQQAATDAAARRRRLVKLMKDL